MDTDKRDKFLTEAMGLHWHEVVFINSTIVQCSCGNSAYVNPCANIDFETWEGFGTLWEWVQVQVWWDGFKVKMDTFLYSGARMIDYTIINPNRFANAIYEFLKEK